MSLLLMSKSAWEARGWMGRGMCACVCVPRGGTEHGMVVVVVVVCGSAVCESRRPLWRVRARARVRERRAARPSHDCWVCWPGHPRHACACARLSVHTNGAPAC